MKNSIPLCFLVLTLVSGCVTRDEMITDSTSRTPTTQIDVFKGQEPNKPFKIIGTLTQVGPRQEELKALRDFVTRAKALGANGLIFEYPPHGDQRYDLGGLRNEYTFKCDLIVYQ